MLSQLHQSDHQSDHKLERRLLPRHGIHTDVNGHPSWQRWLSSFVLLTICINYTLRNVVAIIDALRCNTTIKDAILGSDLYLYEWATIGSLLFARVLTKLIELWRGPAAQPHPQHPTASYTQTTQTTLSTTDDAPTLKDLQTPTKEE